MRLYLLTLALFAMPLAAQEISQIQQSPTAVFVVRHAEKETGPEVGKDPRLTQPGHARAEELLELLGDAGVDAIYVTQWRRTRETAAPIAQALDMQPNIIETVEGFETSLAQRILLEHAGEVVLVVGHSNTNPTLLAALGAQPPTISDDDYDDVYQLVFTASEHGHEAKLLHLGYGQPTP